MKGELMYPGFFTTAGLRYEDCHEWRVGQTLCARVPIDKLTKITEEEAAGRPIFDIQETLHMFKSVSISRATWNHVITISQKTKR
jgi:hypothetical protein